MNKTRANLILHPVRLRIVTELARQQLTPQQLAQLLPSVPQATLYRHISILLEAGILEVVAEQPVNGAIERTYTLTPGAGQFNAEELSKLSADEYLHYFTLFTTSLIDSFAEYIQASDIQHIKEEGMAFQRTIVHLSTEEREQFQTEVTALIGKIMSLTPAPDRKRYTLASIVIPDTNLTFR
jgi:DNA-binding transcriptional ArsR family regulator